MANLISKTNYEAISDYYADLRAALDGNVHYLYDAAYQVVLMTDFVPSLDLQQPFYDVYSNQTSVIQSNTPFLEAIQAINNHVLRRGNYATLDAYLSDQGIEVDPNWADMCSDAGFTISSDYIL